MGLKIVTCRACGIPLEEASKHSCGDVESPYCSVCTTPHGILKSKDQIREQLIRFHIESLGMTREESQKKTDEHMKNLPEWLED
jgi:uncharacterized Zn finger protein (UPF0148 family)